MSTAFLVSLFKMLVDGALFWTVVCPILATLTGLQGATNSPTNFIADSQSRHTIFPLSINSLISTAPKPLLSI